MIRSLFLSLQSILDRTSEAFGTLGTGQLDSFKVKAFLHAPGLIVPSQESQVFLYPQSRLP